MKYGKYLASQQLELPEYSGHFIDYKALKKLIKQLAIPSSQLQDAHGAHGAVYKSTLSASPVEIQNSLKGNKASFFFRVERELDKVNSFYLEKQADLNITLNLLIMRKDELFLKSSQYLRGDSNGTVLVPVPGKLVSGPTNAEANLRNSISFLNLYQNFKKIHQDLIRLQQFIELNETGFLKVVKKWDKRSKSHTKELFILTAVSVQPVFHKNEINELSDLVAQSLFDLESILDGDYSSIHNFSKGQDGKTLEPNLADTDADQLSSVAEGTMEVDGLKLTIEEADNLRRINFQTSRANSFIGFQNSEIDELYTSFVNVATIKGPDSALLVRWVEEVKTTSQKHVSGIEGSSNSIDEDVKLKLSKIFLLSITNPQIPDSFFDAFLNLINYQLDFSYISDGFNNGKGFLHECCSMPITSHEVHHTFINNGVKVVNPTESIVNSRVSLARYMMKKLTGAALRKVLVRKDHSGRTCLHYASQNNRLDILKEISPFFPKEHIDDLDRDSMSPLLLAIKFGNFEMMEKLVEMGSNCCPEADDGRLQYLPINYACRYGDYKTLEFLLARGKPSVDVINQPDVEGLLPLHVVARSGHYILIKLLIDHGADINKFDGLNKWTPIFYAALEGNVKTTQELVKHGANIEIPDDDGYDVLYYCVVEGHISVLNELLSYSNKLRTLSGKDSILINNTDELFAFLSHASEKDTGNRKGSLSILDEEEDSEDSGSLGKNNIDSIPDLQLPPPILPLRRYGHNFLEQKVLIEIGFPSDVGLIKLFKSSTDMKPGRITLTSNISDIVPRNILLPVADTSKVNNNCIFQTDIESLPEFKIDFEIFPKFGTRLIAKTTALSFSTLHPSGEVVSVQLPLFDLRLRNIGELIFDYQVIFPFSGNLLETSKFDTYWKSSTSFVKTRGTLKLNAAGGLSPNNFLSLSNINQTAASPNNTATNAQGSTNENGLAVVHSSFVTASSLHGQYLRIKVCLLNDGTPIVCPQWCIAVTELIILYLPNLSLDQLSSITGDLFNYNKVIQDLKKLNLGDLNSIKKLLKIIYLPLKLFLDLLSPEINLNLEMIFPSAFELENLPFVGNIQLKLNDFIDFTLNDVFNHARSNKFNGRATNGRSIIFLSSNPLICKILNWKQPNYPVFLNMSGIAYNKDANEFELRSINGTLMDPRSMDARASIQQEKFTVLSSEFQQELTNRSVKEAVNFTLNNNLIGLVASIHLLRLVPKLMPLIRSRGLLLIASSDDEGEESILFDRELDLYTRTEINGFRFNDTMSFTDSVTV